MTLSIKMLCYHAACRILFVIILIVIMLSVVMLNVVVLSVKAPIFGGRCTLRVETLYDSALPGCLVLRGTNTLAYSSGV
jgi:hypothetical protein